MSLIEKLYWEGKFPQIELKKNYGKFLGFSRFSVPAGEARSGPPVGPVLAQFQINLSQACKTINEKTLSIYEPGVPVRVSTYILRDKTCDITVIGPSLLFYLDQLDFRTEKITVEQLYDVTRIHADQFPKRLGFSDPWRRTRQFFGFLFSTGVKLDIIFLIQKNEKDKE